MLRVELAMDGPVQIPGKCCIWWPGYAKKGGKTAGSVNEICRVGLSILSLRGYRDGEVHQHLYLTIEDSGTHIANCPRGSGNEFEHGVLRR